MTAKRRDFLGAILAKVSHDLNHPVERARVAVGQEDLGLATEALSELAARLQEWTRLSFPSVVAPVRVVPRTLAEAVIAGESSNWPDVEFDVSGEAPTIRADGDLLRRALRTLVIRAAAAEGASGGRVCLAIHVEEGQLAFRIATSGTLRDAVEPDVDLAIAIRVADLHEGSLSVLNAGYEFRVRLEEA